MFFFQSMFQTVYSGITGSMTLTFVQGVSESILLLALLFALYEAYARGGDTRALGVAALRYLVMGIVISQYPNVFRAVNDAFNNVAATIAPTDVLTNYRAQVAGYLASPAGDSAWWNLVAGGAAGVVSVLFQLVAVFIFPITYVLFAFFYSMYGALLYVFGPLVLALYPVFGIGQLARTYMVNLLIWNAWGIIYAVMSQMLTILNADSLTSILTAQNFGGAFQGRLGDGADLAIEHTAVPDDRPDSLHCQADRVRRCRQHAVCGVRRSRCGVTYSGRRDSGSDVWC